MIGILLPTLFLAAVSDSEGSNEEVWTERFRKADKERKRVEVPLLTPKEKMQILLGAHPTLDETTFLVGFVWKTPASITGEEPRRFQFRWQACVYETEWDILAARPIVYRTPYAEPSRFLVSGDSTDGWEEACLDAKELATRLLLPFSIGIADGYYVVQEGLEVPW
jgi:hypothetical protein